VGLDFIEESMIIFSSSQTLDFIEGTRSPSISQRSHILQLKMMSSQDNVNSICMLDPIQELDARPKNQSSHNGFKMEVCVGLIDTNLMQLEQAQTDIVCSLYYMILMIFQHFWRFWSFLGDIGPFLRPDLGGKLGDGYQLQIYINQGFLKPWRRFRIGLC
jgi:hypothetical protein